ncbi:hypothetical protein C8F04DRAFT_1119288 [Mycena alexandri]|uniref:Uncharacterized protein n=1 Tax=Mycena alexandri TaxID=1745969 RepID=A0AAD6SK89_9AGAR|nr:hypothetical protein C8F04DRAFT_1119288 [Mycena alexandri]
MCRQPPLHLEYPLLPNPFSPAPQLASNPTFRFTSISMRFLNFKTREVYQNVPASSCREIVGVCMEDAVVLIFIVVFTGGLFLVTLGLNLRTRWARRRQNAASNSPPPPYSSIGFPTSSSRDAELSKSGSPSPSVDPYHVVAPSLDNSLLLKDEYFSHVPYPDATVPPSPKRSPPLPSAVALGLGGGVQAGPSTPLSLAMPPPAYVPRPRSDVTKDPAL